ncbi:MAG TPA: sigma-54 dependent transcriptional regulator [Candidatus Acidoferrum sp.]|nr:sigma-54 dependent transcriptional regulator [Candidatus Acidoferrum sp.]
MSTRFQSGEQFSDCVHVDGRDTPFAPAGESQCSPGNSLEQNSPAQADLLNDGSLFVASGRAMQAIRQQIEKIAEHDVPVLILGESGSGKEVVARYLHSRSAKARQPFLKVNCAALPGSLLESELFGYERGAFTGAVRSNPGKFELCKSGTILLDEIGEISPTLQAKLLHVLQDKTVCRLGGNTPVKVDARVIAATNVDICEALESGALRQDLYYRLNTFVLRIPPLRSRPEEIPLLLEHFIEQFAPQYGCPVVRPSRNLVAACLEYSWPGNIRELQSFAQRFLIQGDEDLSIGELQRNTTVVVGSAGEETSVREDFSTNLKKIGRQVKSSAEKPAIERVLQETRFNRKAAARLLKISYKGLLRKLREYELDGKTARLSNQAAEIHG